MKYFVLFLTATGFFMSQQAFAIPSIEVPRDIGEYLCISILV